MLISKRDKFTIFLYLLFICGCLFTIIYFSLQYKHDLSINSQYINYESNITNYNIININNEFLGYIDLKFVIFDINNNNTCSIYIISSKTEKQTIGYLQYYYPLNTFISIYYGNEECIFSLPTDITKDISMITVFSIILILCIIVLLCNFCFI